MTSELFTQGQHNEPNKSPQASDRHFIGSHGALERSRCFEAIERSQPVSRSKLRPASKGLAPING